MKINIITEEWLPFPASYRCIFTIDDGIDKFYFSQKLESIVELEERDSNKMLENIKKSYGIKS